MNLLETMLAVAAVSAIGATGWRLMEEHNDREAMRSTASALKWGRNAVESWLESTRKDRAHGGFAYKDPEFHKSPPERGDLDNLVDLHLRASPVFGEVSIERVFESGNRGMVLLNGADHGLGDRMIVAWRGSGPMRPPPPPPSAGVVAEAIEIHVVGRWTASHRRYVGAALEGVQAGGLRRGTPPTFNDHDCDSDDDGGDDEANCLTTMYLTIPGVPSQQELAGLSRKYDAQGDGLIAPMSFGAVAAEQGEVSWNSRGVPTTRFGDATLPVLHGIPYCKDVRSTGDSHASGYRPVVKASWSFDLPTGESAPTDKRDLLAEQVAGESGSKCPHGFAPDGNYCKAVIDNDACETGYFEKGTARTCTSTSVAGHADAPHRCTTPEIKVDIDAPNGLDGFVPCVYMEHVETTAGQLRHVPAVCHPNIPWSPGGCKE